MPDQHDGEKDRVKVVDRRAFTPDGQRRTPDPAPAPEGSATESSILGEGFQIRPTGTPAPRQPPPAVQFNAFIVSLASTAFIHLGELDDPVTGKKETNLDGARQMIDILDMLRDKTNGNLDPAETELINGVLYELKLKYASKVSGK